MAKRSNTVDQTFEICLSNKMFCRLDTSHNIALRKTLLLADKNVFESFKNIAKRILPFEHCFVRRENNLKAEMFDQK